MNNKPYYPSNNKWKRTDQFKKDNNDERVLPFLTGLVIGAPLFGGFGRGYGGAYPYPQPYPFPYPQPYPYPVPYYGRRRRYY